MQLRISEPFRKRLAKKPPKMQGVIMECVSHLAENSRLTGLHTHAVQGHHGVFEAYIDDANRVTFHYEDGVLVLRMHCNHDMLRNP